MTGRKISAFQVKPEHSSGIFFSYSISLCEDFKLKESSSLLNNPKPKTSQSTDQTNHLTNRPTYQPRSLTPQPDPSLPLALLTRACGTRAPGREP